MANSIDPDQTEQSDLGFQFAHTVYLKIGMGVNYSKQYKPRHEKTCLRGFRPG